MSAIKINDSVYSMGVLNPALRVFDIIMTAEYGTSYNSYLIKGDKNVLIETVHEKFFDEFLRNLRDIIEISEIDYLIMNHTEPDHSGSVAKLLSVNPNITVICSPAAKKYLTKIVNMDFKCLVVKNGDELDLGDRKLKFIVSPFLHWPDSMFTYSESDRILFSCDVFGAHYCEPTMFDSHIHYPDKYEEAFKYYFDSIFSPFKDYVISGLDKIKDLNFDKICPSHGPVHINNIDKRLRQYREWSSPKPSSNKNIAIVYASAYGYTQTLARVAKEVIELEYKLEVSMYDIVTAPKHDVETTLNAADAIMIGSCTINKNIPPPLADALNYIDPYSVKSKPATAFGSFGWSGEAVNMIKERLQNLKFKFFGDGYKINFKPNEDELEAMKKYTRNFVDSLK